MFGESDSESPRVPSPWDSILSSPPSPGLAPGAATTTTPLATARTRTPSPLASSSSILIPRLVPESDDGNVEYKLQLLNPTYGRLVRLVTQLKWRLLEGGGQAYYELGVADSGHLIGLSRDELEQSLDTLDEMAGQIGASVIVVKEIEIPVALAELAKKNADSGWSTSTVAASETEDSTGLTDSTDDVDEDTEDQEGDDLSATVVLDRGDDLDRGQESGTHSPNDKGQDDFLALPGVPGTYVGLEISSVYKPRPMKKPTHVPHTNHAGGRKGKRVKKRMDLNDSVHGLTHELHDKSDAVSRASYVNKSEKRRQGRERRREEKRVALESRAAAATAVIATGASYEGRAETTISATTATSKAVDLVVPNISVVNDHGVKDSKASWEGASQTDTLVAGLDSLHVGNIPGQASELVIDVVAWSVDVRENTSPETGAAVASTNGKHEEQIIHVNDEDDDDDDLFGGPMTSIPSVPRLPKSAFVETHLDVDPHAINIAALAASASNDDGEAGADPSATRMIVEVLVVWKVPSEGAFLDFEGWI